MVPTVRLTLPMVVEKRTGCQISASLLIDQLLIERAV